MMDREQRTDGATDERTVCASDTPRRSPVTHRNQEVL